MAQNCEVEAGFIAEMVVDGSDVGSGAGADIADGGSLEAVFGEDLAGGIDQASAGGVGVRGEVAGWGWLPLKHQIKTVV